MRHDQYHQSSGKLKLQRDITYAVKMPLKPMTGQAHPQGTNVGVDTVGGNLSQNVSMEGHLRSENRTTVESGHPISWYMSKGN